MSIAATIRRLANLSVPVEAMREMFLVLAEQLERDEARKASHADAQKRHRQVLSDITVISPSYHTGLARVEDNNLSSLTVETVRKEDPPLSPPSSKPLRTSEPEGFREFMSVYPRRDHSFDRKKTLAGYIPALQRASHETIMEGVRHYAQAMADRGKVGTEFVALPRTWLNQDRWKIRYETARTHHKPNTIADGFAKLGAILDGQIAEAESGQGVRREDTQALPRLRQGTG